MHVAKIVKKGPKFFAEAEKEDSFAGRSFLDLDPNL